MPNAGGMADSAATLLVKLLELAMSDRIGRAYLAGWIGRAFGFLYSAYADETAMHRKSGARFRLWDDAPGNVPGARQRCRDEIPRIFSSIRVQRKVRAPA